MSAALGVLMLQTRFPRPPGDVGHPQSWRMPVRYRVVQGAAPGRIVPRADPQLLEPFVAEARALVDDGVRAITTSCGFLVRWQDELQAAVPVPVWTSSLLKLRQLDDAGVLTVDADSLRPDDLRRAGADPSTPVVGLQPGCHLQRVLLEDLPAMDARQAASDAVHAACELVRRHPRVRHIVLECTNLPPYAEAIADATGRAVHHLMSFVHERWEPQA